MPNSLYAATALPGQNFMPQFFPGPYGAQVEIDGSIGCKPASSSMADAAGDPKESGSGREFRWVQNPGQGGCESGCSFNAL
jgi:hypothetical protein